MRFAIVAFGLRDIVEEVASMYDVDVFNGLDEVDVDEYDFLLLTSELGGVEGDKLISALKNLNCNVVIFCTTATSFEGLQRSRYQASEILNIVEFEGAIVSGFLSFEDKVEALRTILDEKLDHLASK